MNQGPVTHFSYSQLSTYLQCPLKYRLKYVQLVPAAFTPSALVFGKCIHEAVAAFYDQRLIGSELKPGEMVDVYREAWSSRQHEEIRFFNGDSADTLLDKARVMLGAFHDSFDPDVEILGVEEFFETDISPRVPPFQGYIDLIEQGPDGRISIVDLKTASRKPSVSQAQSNLQLTAYAIGAGNLGFDVENLRYSLHVLTKTKTPELVKLTTERTEQERRRFVKLAGKVWNAIEKETWFPREDWHCQQCAWAEACAQW